MMVLVTLLVVSLMHGVWLYFKASNRISTNHQAFYDLEAAAQQLRLTKNIFNQENCFIAGKDPNQIIDSLYKNKGCSFYFDKSLYFYVIENLGQFPCLQIIERKKIHASQHIRVTLASSQHAALQIRIANVSGLSECKQSIHLINQGIISWRYLTI